MKKITPFLWFNNDLQEAIEFYKSVFKNITVTQTNTYPEGGPEPAGKLMTASFVIEGQEFVALNCTSEFRFNESISFVINCDTQEEIDHYWEELSKGGQTSYCGWLKDRFGLSWQIVPSIMGKLYSDPDKQKTVRVMQAMMQMSKFDIPILMAAYNGH
ncbi:VOC family protein [Mucilaginibacter sp.]|uniref:VOC family protein n=1 Tax=Mucilaginibacter sp. TaxID=1882438 RepID=UPI000CA7CEBA|nr:VOC family protein [Mucilaginibacter sp.]PLW88304.1 MAG: hypothetical protein C0154_17225 [Mucilaginibacter sp.]PMP65208.1 MAG: hypothetical protein C0191_04125 [Mucilaginibacter sp.]HEK21220.1 VOC family protein [Bacteroidota bacterium]